jgi:hypothetical protein
MQAILQNLVVKNDSMVKNDSTVFLVTKMGFLNTNLSKKK